MEGWVGDVDEICVIFFPLTLKPGCWDVSIFKDLGNKTPKSKLQACQVVYLLLLWNPDSPELLFIRRPLWPKDSAKGMTSYSPIKHEMGGWKMGLELNNRVQNV